MRVIALGLAAALLTGGCALFTTPTDTVHFDRVEVALALGDIQALVAVLEAKAQARCANGAKPAFSPQTCQQIQATIDQAAALKQEVVTALRNPQAEVDWQRVAAVLKLLVSIAMKFL